MVVTTPDIVPIQEQINVELDKAYHESAGDMLKQIRLISGAPASPMQKALTELDEEVDRLNEADEPMTADNAHLMKAMNEYENTFNVSETLIQTSDELIQNTGLVIAVSAVTAKVFRGIALEIVSTGGNPISPRSLSIFAARIALTGASWNIPESIDFAEDYVNSAAWINRLTGWGVGYVDLTNGVILEGIQKGWSPNYIATYLRNMATNMPLHAAETLTRTLQLTSYRDGEVAMEKLNGGFIQKKIRIATLDDRTCLSCVALHGTELKPGERVDDHYRGRCSVYYVVPGGDPFPDVMQADSTPGKRNFVPFQSGEEWFASLPEARQKNQASMKSTPAKFKAYQDGIPLSEFVKEHKDNVFGMQIVENSLVGALGNKGTNYYLQNTNE